MKRLASIASALLLTGLATAQRPQDPIRNTFATAAESVIDSATGLDIKADAASYDPRMTQLKAMQTNLRSLAEGDAETNVVAAINDILYTLSACRIQALNDTDTTACSTRLSHATVRAMTSLRKHKVNGAWADGPPS